MITLTMKQLIAGTGYWVVLFIVMAFMTESDVIDTTSFYMGGAVATVVLAMSLVLFNLKNMNKRLPGE
jgi:hypothetical protein